MELYTLVSLVIGIFGATYAALNSLRTNFDGRIQDALASADKEMEAMATISARNKYDLTSCKGHRSAMSTARIWWLWAHAVPAICFLLVMAYIMYGVFSYWDEVMVQHTGDALVAIKQHWPWSFLKGCLEVLAAVDALCVVTAGIALAACFSRHSRLLEHHNSLKAVTTLQNPTEASE